MGARARASTAKKAAPKAKGKGAKKPAPAKAKPHSKSEAKRLAVVTSPELEQLAPADPMPPRALDEVESKAVLLLATNQQRKEYERAEDELKGFFKEKGAGFCFVSNEARVGVNVTEEPGREGWDEEKLRALLTEEQVASCRKTGAPYLRVTVRKLEETA